MQRIHVLKVWPRYFEVLRTGEKTFEVRRDDRGFQRGDILKLCETTDDGKGLTGEYAIRRVLWILTGGQFGVEPGFVVMALSVEPDSPEVRRG